MPIYRYQCPACGDRSEQIHGIDAEPSPTACHDLAPLRLMPRRVRGRVLEPGQVEQERAREQSNELRLRAGDRDVKLEPGPLDIPAASYSGPPRDKQDLEARRRDTTEAMASWQTRSLVADGVPYETAKRKAEKHQQSVTAYAEAQDNTQP